MSQIFLHYYNFNVYRPYPDKKYLVWTERGLTAQATYFPEEDKFYSLDGSELNNVLFYAEIPPVRVLMSNDGKLI